MARVMLVTPKNYRALLISIQSTLFVYNHYVVITNHSVYILRNQAHSSLDWYHGHSTRVGVRDF